MGEVSHRDREDNPHYDNEARHMQHGNRGSAFLMVEEVLVGVNPSCGCHAMLVTLQSIKGVVADRDDDAKRAPRVPLGLTIHWKPARNVSSTML